jgi:type IV secretion system protein VirD4
VNRKIKIAIAGLLLTALVIYGTGIASQLVYAVLSWLGNEVGPGQGLAGIISGANTETDISYNSAAYAYGPAASASLNIGQPRYVFAALLNFPYNLYGLGIVALLAGLIIIFLRKNNSVQGTMDNERNIIYSNKGTYGTAGWMTDAELYMELEVTKNLKHCRGTILGELPGAAGKVVCVPEDTIQCKRRWRLSALRAARTSFRHPMNRNVAVYGAAGSMKSRAYVRNMVFQCVRRGESLIITDPKSELYASMAEYLRDKGYVVKVFNLISPENSDSWNCLREIEGDNQEFMAQIFCDVVIRNTLLNNRLDPFWDTGAISLLKTLCLYVVQVYPEADRNIGEVYKLLANVASGGDGGGLKAAFAALPFGHSAKAPFDIFRQASENVQSGIIIGLANHIQVFQIEVLRTITSHNNGIDLTLPGKERCAYFCITSDQDSTFDFLSSLFLSFLFIKLVRFADSQPNQSLPVPVHLLADELANIGVIPDLTKKISTIRSRKISMSVIFQNIAQMKNRYPDDAWLEIIGNADTQLFLGCTDEMTAKFISDRTGEVTIGVESTAREMRAMRLSNYIPSQRETSSIGKRKLLTPDEVLRMPREDALVIFRGQKVLKVKKFDFTKHPESKKLRKCNVRNYVPNWRPEDRFIRLSPKRTNEDFSFLDVGEESTAPISRSVERKKSTYRQDSAVELIQTIKAKRRRPNGAANPVPQTAPKPKPVLSSDSKPILKTDEANEAGVARASTLDELPLPASVAIPKRKHRSEEAEEHWMQGELDIIGDDEPFKAIDIDDLLSD